jgi:hypothetical protein
MLSISIIITCILSNILNPDITQVQEWGNAQQLDFCALKGTVYIADNPDDANFYLYEEDSEAFADFLIYETDNALFATEPGKWYFTDEKGFADFSVYFVESKGHADFTVYFTSFESFAGCNK